MERVVKEFKGNSLLYERRFDHGTEVYYLRGVMKGIKVGDLIGQFPHTPILEVTKILKLEDSKGEFSPASDGKMSYFEAEAKEYEDTGASE